MGIIDVSKKNKRIAGDLPVECRRCGKGYAEKLVYDSYLTIFYVPLIPLWKASEWQCSNCKADPTSKIGVSRGLLALLICLLMPACVLMWVFAFTEWNEPNKFVMPTVTTVGIIVLITVCWKHGGSQTATLEAVFEETNLGRRDSRLRSPTEEPEPQLVNSHCAICEMRISSILQAQFCDSCRQPIHNECVHKTEDNKESCPACGASLDD